MFKKNKKNPHAAENTKWGSGPFKPYKRSDPNAGRVVAGSAGRLCHAPFDPSDRASRGPSLVFNPRAPGPSESKHPVILLSVGLDEYII